MPIDIGRIRRLMGDYDPVDARKKMHRYQGRTGNKKPRKPKCTCYGCRRQYRDDLTEWYAHQDKPSGSRQDKAAIRSLNRRISKQSNVHQVKIH